MDMDRVFYIFRHGETDWNQQKRLQGHTNVPLNKAGHEQANALAMQLSSIAFDALYSSDLDRALQTARIVLSKQQSFVAFHNDSRLREMSYGEAEGLDFTEAMNLFSEQMLRLRTFKEEDDHIFIPGGETRKASRERFFEVLKEIIDETEYQTIGISTHGGALRNVFHSILPAGHPVIEIPNCVVYRLFWNSVNKSFRADVNPL